MRVTIGSARGPQSWTMRAKSPRWKRARPRANAASASTAPPMNRSISTTPPEAAVTAVPIRPSHGKGAASWPVLRSGTAAARASRRRAPSGRPVRSTSAPADAASSITLAAKVKRPVSQAVTSRGVEGEASGRGGRGQLRLDLCGVRELIEHLPAPGKLQHERAVGGPTHGEGPRARGRRRGGGAPPPHARARTIRTR